jgi:uncharacterized protein
MSTAKPFPYSGAIDSDGHVLEPPDLWEKYIEPEFRDRALRFRKRKDGVEQLEIGGHPSKYMPPEGLLALAGGMGKSKEEWQPDRNRTYKENAPFGSMDPKERLLHTEQVGLEKAILYPSLGLIWETEIEDVALAAAHAQAYNRWIVDFCADSGGRLIPIAHISMGDPQEAARELERAVKAGCKGVFVAPYTISNKSHANPDYDRFWAAAQDLDAPVGIHPGAEPPAKRVHQRFHDMKKWALWHFNVHGGQGPLQAFTALFQYGLFDRFPKVKVVVLESGAGWAGYLLNRMDAVYDSVMFGHTVPLKEKPSYYFHRQCWISGDPDEKAFGHIIDFVGADKFFWASDFPHPDHPGNFMEELAELVDPLSESTRRKVLGENAARVYGL